MVERTAAKASTNSKRTHHSKQASSKRHSHSRATRQESSHAYADACGACLHADCRRTSEVDTGPALASKSGLAHQAQAPRRLTFQCAERRPTRAAPAPHPTCRTSMKTSRAQPMRRHQLRWTSMSPASNSARSGAPHSASHFRSCPKMKLTLYSTHSQRLAPPCAREAPHHLHRRSGRR